MDGEIDQIGPDRSDEMKMDGQTDPPHMPPLEGNNENMAVIKSADGPDRRLRLITHDGGE